LDDGHVEKDSEGKGSGVFKLKVLQGIVLRKVDGRKREEITGIERYLYPSRKLINFRKSMESR
jgi:hypothetical protein